MAGNENQAIYNQLVKPENLNKIPGFNDDTRAKLHSTITSHWSNIQRTTPQDPIHQASVQQLRRMTDSLRQHVLQQRNAAQNPQANRPGMNPGQPSQPQQSQGQMNIGQSAGQQQANQAQLAQAQRGQASQLPQSTQPSQNEQSPVGQGQPAGQSAQPSQAILNHLATFVFTHPVTHPKGTPQGEEWIKTARGNYLKLLVILEQTSINGKKIGEQIEKLRQQGQPISPQLQQAHDSLRQRSANARSQVDTFRTQQAKMREQQGMAPSPSQNSTQQSTQPSAVKKETNTTTTTGTAQSPAFKLTMPVKAQQKPGSAPNPTIDAAKTNAARQSASPISAHPPQSATSQTHGPTSFPPSAPGQSQPNQQQNQPAARPVMNTQQATPTSAATGRPGAPTQNAQPGQAISYTHRDAIDAARSNSEQQGSAPSSQQQQPPSGFVARSQNESQPDRRFPIPKTLPPSAAAPPTPVAAGPQRPTMANGGASSQPIIPKQAAYILEGDENPHVLSKKKLDELVREVTGGADTLTPEAEEVIMEVADEFIDNVIAGACRLAKLRQDATLDIRDIQIVLERNYNIRIPGYSLDETRVVRRVNPAPSWTQKMNAVNAAKVMNGTKTDL